MKADINSWVCVCVCVNISCEHTNIDSHFLFKSNNKVGWKSLIDPVPKAKPCDACLRLTDFHVCSFLHPLSTVGAGGREAPSERLAKRCIRTCKDDRLKESEHERKGTAWGRAGPCLDTVGLLIDFLTLSSVAALSIFTSGRRRPPGPGPMSDTTPLQSTVLFLFPWKPV